MPDRKTVTLMTVGRLASQKDLSACGKKAREREVLMKKTATTGAILATAVALMFMANPGFAQEASPTSSQQAKVKCVGANDCKGKSACKTATSPGPGQNSCKGQGLRMTSTEQECKDKGGKPITM
jgi:hypothetical protein